MKLSIPSVSPSLVFDVGNANTLILGAQKNILVYEPTLVLSDNEGVVLLVGEEAKHVTSDERLVKHLTCVEQGSVTNEEYCVEFLSHFQPQIPIRTLSLVFPQAIGVAVPSAFTIEQATVWNRVYRRLGFSPWYYPSSVGIANAYRIKEGRSSPQLVLECGASRVEISVVELGRVIHTASYPWGGRELDHEIQLHLFSSLGMIVSLDDIESAKINSIGGKQAHVVRGKDTKTSKVVSLKLTSDHLEPALHIWRERLARFLSFYLSDLPPSMLSGVEREGILFAGGCSQIHGLDSYLENTVGFSFHTISRPQLAGALGIHGIMTGAQKDSARVGL